MKSNNAEIKSELFEKINNSDVKYLSHGHYPKHGEIVKAGLIANTPRDFDHYIGYVVQIRQKRGQYGSDQYLVRHPDGSLTNHENQAFWLVPKDLAEKALSLFVKKPDEEDKSTTYTVGMDFPENGYIIEFHDGDPVGDSPSFGLTITQE